MRQKLQRTDAVAAQHQSAMITSLSGACDLFGDYLCEIPHGIRQEIDYESGKDMLHLLRALHQRQDQLATG
ncbi:hypothetical protein [Paracoccus mutanolyticus]|nr:hypothetical protein [Paracoccus mutanolyticus]